MASAAFKRKTQNNQLGKETFVFLQKKLMTILPFHIIIFSVKYIYILIIKTKSVKTFLSVVIEAIPNFFLIQRSGLYNLDILGVEWYISEMLIVMLILYPVCLKYYDCFSRIIAPALAVFILGYLSVTTGALNNSVAWSVIFSKTFLRAFSEICAGVFTFEVCRNIKRLHFSKMDKVFLTVIEAFSYFMIVFFILYDFPKGYGATFLIFVCIAVCLSFSDVTYGNTWFNNKVVYYLGSLSLPLYLCQSSMRDFARFCSGFTEPFFVILIFLATTFAYALAVKPLERRCRKVINKKIDRLTRD